MTFALPNAQLLSYEVGKLQKFMKDNFIENSVIAMYMPMDKEVQIENYLLLANVHDKSNLIALYSHEDDEDKKKITLDCLDKLIEGCFQNVHINQYPLMLDGVVHYLKP